MAVNTISFPGLFLHSRVVTNVFETKTPFKMYYFIGWGKSQTRSPFVINNGISHYVSSCIRYGRGPCNNLDRNLGGEGLKNSSQYE